MVLPARKNSMSRSKQEKNEALVLEAFDTLFNKRDYVAAERLRRWAGRERREPAPRRNYLATSTGQNRSRPATGLLLFCRTWGSNCSVPERTGGEAGIQMNQAMHDETALSPLESTRSSRDGISLHNTGNTRCVRRRACSGNLRKDAVSVGGSEGKGSGRSTVREIHCKLPGHRGLTKVSGDSAAAPGNS